MSLLPSISLSQTFVCERKNGENEGYDVLRRHAEQDQKDQMSRFSSFVFDVL